MGRNATGIIIIAESVSHRYWTLLNAEKAESTTILPYWPRRATPANREQINQFELFEKMRDHNTEFPPNRPNSEEHLKEIIQ